MVLQRLGGGKKGKQDIGLGFIDLGDDHLIKLFEIHRDGVPIADHHLWIGGQIVPAHQRFVGRSRIKAIAFAGLGPAGHGTAGGLGEGKAHAVDR